MPKEVDVLLVALSSPIKIGVYEDTKLLETIESAEKSSDVLPILFRDLQKKYTLKNFFMQMDLEVSWL